MPNHYMELEVFALDNTMWRIPCINHPPLLTIPIWHQWASLTPKNLVKYWENAIGGMFISKVHIMSTIFPMKAFATPRSGKYKCMTATNVCIKVHLPTDNN